MPINLEVIEEKTKENIKKTYDKLNEVGNTDTEVAVNTERDFLNFQLLNLNKNIERMKNFKIEEQKFNKKREELNTKINNVAAETAVKTKYSKEKKESDWALQDFSSDLQTQFEVKRNMIEKEKEKQLNNVNEFIKAAKSRINSQNDIEGIFEERKKDEKAEQETYDDIIRKGLKTYKISEDTFRKWKDESDLQKRNYSQKANTSTMDFNSKWETDERKENLDKHYEQLDKKLNDYFVVERKRIQQHANDKYNEFYQELDKEAGIENFGKNWAKLNEKRTETVDVDKSQEQWLKEYFYKLAETEKVLFNKELLVITNNKDRDLEKNILRLNSEVKEGIDKINCDIIVKDYKKGPIIDQRQKLDEQRTKTKAKITKKHNRTFKISTDLDTKEYGKEKTMTKEYLAAIESATIDDFYVCKNPEKKEDFHFLYKSSINALERHLLIKQCEKEEENLKLREQEVITSIEQEKHENLLHWNVFKEHQLSEIEKNSKLLDNIQLYDLQMEWRKAGLSGSTFDSWENFSKPVIEKMDDEECIKKMNTLPNALNSELGESSTNSNNNSPKYLHFPNTEDEWKKNKERAEEHISQYNKQEEKKQEKIIEDLQKQLEEAKAKKEVFAQKSKMDDEKAEQRRKEEEQRKKDEEQKRKEEEQRRKDEEQKRLEEKRKNDISNQKRDKEACLAFVQS